MVKGRGTGRGNGIAGSAAQATGTSSKNESKSKQQNELPKKVTKEHRKIKEKEKSVVDSPAPMATRARMVNDKKKVELDSVQQTNDKKATHKAQKIVSSERVQGETKEKEITSALTETPKIESPVGVDAVGYEILSGKPIHSTEKALLACASSISAKNKSSHSSDLLQVSNQKAITKKKRNLDTLALKALEALELENKAKDIKTTSVVDKSISRMQYSKETDEMGQNIDTKSLEVEQDLSSEGIEFISCGIEATALQYPKEPDDIFLLKLSKETSKIKQELSLEKEKLMNLKFNVDGFTPMLQFSQDIDERKLSLKSWKLQQKQSSEVEKKVSESKCEENKFTTVLPCSKDIDNQKLNFDPKALKVQDYLPVVKENKITAAKLEAARSMLALLDSKLPETKEKTQNVDLSASVTNQDTSEYRNESDPEKEKPKEIINLRENVNLRFEFDTLDVKSILVDNKDRYTADKNQKMTFNIGDGNVYLSFIDNKVCISAPSGDIDCSIRKNQVIFSLTDSFVQSDSSPEDSNINELSPIKDTEVSKDLGSTNIIGTTTKPSLDQFEEIQQEQEYKNVHKSTLKTNSSVAANSLVQKRVLNASELFLARIASSCKDFKIEFLDCLKKRNNE